MSKKQEYFRKYAIQHKNELAEYRHQYHKKNKSRIHRQKRKYYQKNKEYIRRKNSRNRNYRNAYSKSYYKKHKREIIQNCCRRFKRRYHTDSLFKVKSLLRCRLGDVCKRKKLIKPKTMQLLGCDLPTFKLHIESKFVTGMTWDNHGKWGWHIDHLVPLDSAKTSTDLERLCHYKNLQPLWWYDNLSKNNKQ